VVGSAITGGGGHHGGYAPAPAGYYEGQPAQVAPTPVSQQQQVSTHSHIFVDFI
jgi:hypothetical protein